MVVIASTTPGIFSAGADLRDLARLAGDVPARAAFRDAMRDGIEAVAALPMPTIAAVEGGCFGAAVALALACDCIVAGTEARFAVPPARLGIAYPAPDVARLVRRVGQGAARRLLFTADAVDAEEAPRRIGLVDTIEDPHAMAARIAGNDPAALALLKAMAADPHALGHDAAFANRSPPRLRRRHHHTTAPRLDSPPKFSACSIGTNGVRRQTTR
ncbi:enoyl-CoA hydratase/isomerase family protein [Sphingomonas sp. MMS24-JH45]